MQYPKMENSNSQYAADCARALLALRKEIKDKNISELNRDDVLLLLHESADLLDMQT